MGCLKDILCGKRVIIGIKDYDACATSESGLTINEIPGITLKKAAAIQSEEFNSGADMLNNLIKRAIRLTFQEWTEKISPQFEFNAVTSARMLNHFKAPAIAPAAISRGLVIKRWRSELSQLFVENVYIQTVEGGDVTFNIIDGGKTVPFTATLLPNAMNTIRTDYIADSEQIQIVMDNTSQTVYGGSIYLRSPWGGINGECNVCGGGGGLRDMYITGWNGTAEQNNYFGIGADVSVRCYEENIICKLLSRMYFLFWYRTAICYFEEQLSSDRINPITIFTKDKAEQNLLIYTEKYNNAFKNFVPTIKSFLISTKGECIQCKGMKYAQQTP